MKWVGYEMFVKKKIYLSVLIKSLLKKKRGLIKNFRGCQKTCPIKKHQYVHTGGST